MKFHLERERAESFGRVAVQYDRYRPSFPAPLVDELVARRPAHVLDVGTGTGKVAVALARHGLDVVGVEVDPRMAELAREKGVRVEIARFEDWDDAGRRFDLVTNGDAWHWIEPEAGMAKVAKLLHVGGTMARFWNSMVLDGDVLSVLVDLYRAHAPSAWVYGQAPPEHEDLFGMNGWRSSSAFASIETKIYRWELTFDAEDWVQFMATISDHQRLGAESLATLQGVVREALRRLGGVVQVHGRTYAMFALRGPATR